MTEEILIKTNKVLNEINSLENELKICDSKSDVPGGYKIAVFNEFVDIEDYKSKITKKLDLLKNEFNKL